MGSELHEFTQLPGAAEAHGAPVAAIRGSAQRAAGEPLVGFIYNPRSRGNRGGDFAQFDRPGVLNARPDTRGEIPGVMARFAKAGIDLLVINGGDGTIRDVLTAGQPFFGQSWPAIAVMPKGKTNALNADLGAPSEWDLGGIIEAYKTGERHTRRPLALQTMDESGARPVGESLLGFIIGAGAIAQGVKSGQDAHRLGAFNSFAIGLTGLWGVLTSIFGSDANPWRSGVGAEILLGGEVGEPLPFIGPDGGKAGSETRRFLLLSTTLERLPMGIRPFGLATRDAAGAIKLAVMDRPRRWLVALFPAIVMGFAPDWLARAGFHQVATERMVMALDEQFILDGEVFPAGRYLVSQGPPMDFVVP